MKTFDLRKIKRALEHGDIQKVADLAGVDARIVSETLANGWHPDRRNEIVAAALNVIRDKGENPELVKEAEAMKMTADTFVAVHRKPQHRFQKGNQYGRKSKGISGVLLFALIGGAALLALRGLGVIGKQN